MTTDQEPESHVQIMPLGELRMIGINPPAALQDAPGDDMLSMPRPAAQKWARQILQLWNVTETDAEAFLPTLSNEDLSDVIVIHQFVRVLFTTLPPADYMQAQNKAFDEKSAWQLVQRGEAKRVRAYLAYIVFNGGW